MTTAPTAPPPLHVRLAAAAGSSLVTLLLTTPLEVVKTRQQTAPRPARAPASAVASAAAAAARACVRYCQACGRRSSAALARGRSAAYLLGRLAAPAPAAMSLCVCHGPLAAGRPAAAEAACASAAAAAATSPAASAAGAPGGRAAAGALATMLAVARMEGISALWSGLAPSLLMSLPSTALYFTAYDEIKGALESSPRVHAAGLAGLAPLLAGVAARSLAAVVVSPLELLRTKAMHRRSELSLLATAREEMRRGGGAAALWRGIGPTLARDVPFSGIYWLGYERLKRWGTSAAAARHHQSSGGGGGEVGASVTWAVSFLAGLASGSFAAFVTTPFDVAKTRMQVQLGAAPAFVAATASAAAPVTAAAPLAAVARPARESTLAVLRAVVREEGLRGLLAGVQMRVARVGVACAIMVSSFEIGKRFLA